jgi:hypothetical protein
VRTIVQTPRNRARLADVAPGRLGCQPGASRRVLDELMAAESTKPAAADRQPLPMTDWQARIAADLGEAINARWDKLRVRTTAVLADVERSYAMGVCMLTAPFLADVDGLLHEQLPAWRVLNAMPMPEAPITTAKAEVAAR